MRTDCYRARGWKPSKLQDEIGADEQAWAVWTRGWTAEENRHGDVLNKWLYLSGRVDMRSVESTIQRLIGSGLDPKVMGPRRASIIDCAPR